VVALPVSATAAVKTAAPDELVSLAVPLSAVETTKTATADGALEAVPVSATATASVVTPCGGVCNCAHDM
jgi:hypothetical protein